MTGEEKSKSRSPVTTLGRYLPAALILCVGIALSGSSFTVARNWERQGAEAEFQRHAEDRVSALKRGLEFSLYEVESLGGLYAASISVEPAEFREFAMRYLAHAPGTQALEWIPRVPRGERERFEEAARLLEFEDLAKCEAFARFQITEREAEGKMITAGERDEYYPVYYVEPYGGNEAAVGFDLASDPTRLETLKRSRDTGEMLATARITLVQETRDQYGFLVFLPVYRKDAPADSLEDRRDSLLGFVLGVFRVGDILEKALTYLEPLGIDLHLLDQSAPEGKRFLCSHASRTREVLAKPIRPLADLRGGLHHEVTLDVAGRRWLIVCSPTPGFMAAGKTWDPWAVLAFGLGLTGLLTNYLLASIDRARRAERAEKEIKSLARFPSENANPVLRVSRDGTVMYANKASAPLLDSFGAQTGQRLAPRWRQQLADVLRVGTSRDIEVECGDRTFSLICTPIASADYMNIYGRDITERTRAAQERRQLEAQLRQSQKMEAIGQLAGGVAHDFNNLLTGIIGYSQLLLHQLEEDSPMSRDLTQIRTLADRAASLTRQLLAFARRQPLQPVVLNINTLIENTSKMLGRLIGEDIDMQFVAATDLGNVRADPGQIEQVLMNLAVNARDAMPGGGKLTIETANVMLDQYYASNHVGVKPGPYVMLAVTDTGAGMDQETQQRMFEPFFTTKEAGRGTGLGLSTVYGIVKQHGGGISVRSAPGNGTTFRVYVPLVAAEAEPLLVKTTEAPAPGGGETVLLVEDEEMVRVVTQRILEQQGYDVLVAADAGEAEQMFAERSDKVALLLADVVMPGGSGPDLYERLARYQPALRALYISGYTESRFIPEELRRPGPGYLQKPFSPDVLSRKVRDVLDDDG